MQKEICFFIKTNDPSIVSRNEFYIQDVKALEALGYKVKVATKIHEIDIKSDLIYVWWWTWAFVPIIISKIFRIKTVITGVFDHYIEGNPVDLYKRNWLHRSLILYSLKNSTANIVVSELEYNFIQENLSFSKLFLNPLSIDLKEFTNGNLNRENFILSISWLSKNNVKRKCILETINIFNLVSQKHHDLKLVIVGKEGDGLDLVKQEIKKLSLENRVELMGPISKDHKIKLLQSCKIYLQPTRVEGFGLAILEAMACGAPVFTSNNGTISEVTKGAAVYINPDDYLYSSNQIDVLLSNPDNYKKAVNKGLQVAADFSADKKIERLSKIIKSVV